jgi:hypothetical protein
MAGPGPMPLANRWPHHPGERQVGAPRSPRTPAVACPLEHLRMSGWERARSSRAHWSPSGSPLPGRGNRTSHQCRRPHSACTLRSRHPSPERVVMAGGPPWSSDGATCPPDVAFGRKNALSFRVSKEGHSPSSHSNHRKQPLPPGLLWAAGGSNPAPEAQKMSAACALSPFQPL